MEARLSSLRQLTLDIDTGADILQTRRQSHHLSRSELMKSMMKTQKRPPKLQLL